MDNGRSLIVKLSLDMIPVIAGILIALFINSLQENYSDKKLLESTLQSLEGEFSRNQSNIETLLPRQQTFLDSLQHYLSEKSYSVSDIGNKTKGMGTPELYSTHWRSSLSNNSMRLLNFKTVTLLSQIDSKHNELGEQERFIFSIFYGPPMFKRGEEGWEYRKGLEQWVIAYMANERELIKLYSQFKEIVQSNTY